MRRATICPSEAARALSTATGVEADWRDMMPKVNAAVDRLLAEGRIRLTWKGHVLPSQAGPYRIGRGERN